MTCVSSGGTVGVLARAHVIDVKFTGGLVSNGTLDHAELSVVALVLGWGWGG